MEQIIEKLRELYNSKTGKVHEVYEVFKEFYGEDRVELQNNEYDNECDNFVMAATSHHFTSYLSNHLIEAITAVDKDLSTEDKQEILRIKDESRNTGITVASLFKNPVIFNFYANLLLDFFLRNSRWDILIYFGDVRVTNEFDKFIDIKGVWAKVTLYFDGKFYGSGFGLNRSIYNVTQFREGYMHSHVSSIPRDNLSNFQGVCTGSGPINNTIASLRNNFNAALWNLFCLELSLFVKVESIAGVPYNRLENVGRHSSSNVASEYSMEYTVYTRVAENSFISYEEDTTHTYIEDFCKFLLNKNVLSFNYANGSYGLGLSFKDAILVMTDVFIEWYNSALQDLQRPNISSKLNLDNLFVEVFLQNNNIYITGNSRGEGSYQTDRDFCLQYVGKKVCTFKGKDILLEIEGIEETPEDNKIIVINPIIAEKIITAMLLILNTQYGKEDRGESNSPNIRTQRRYI